MPTTLLTSTPYAETLAGAAALLGQICAYLGVTAQPQEIVDQARVLTPQADDVPINGRPVEGPRHAAQ